ncbi:hypothetical protein KS4_27830 [Poriferisphaera corsica]|uniref:Uncharacterized protein n=1 Tax=Poriferisphaera corsica TaxID=2528020 RepID=A0A517YWX5_9BACT|nr:hypothetical protein KS4_27830 [Poriferisphaera corsica]
MLVILFGVKVLVPAVHVSDAKMCVGVMMRVRGAMKL